MSLFALVDDVDQGQVATIKGWSDFCDWADRQPHHELRHLAFHGYATHLVVLADAIAVSLVESPVRPDVESVARGIEDICRENPNAEILIVSDGVGAECDDDDDELYVPFDDDPVPPKTPQGRPSKKPSGKPKAVKSETPKKKAITSKPSSKAKTSSSKKSKGAK